MGDKEKKFEENAPGPFYVDTSCIGCMLCVEIAGENFAMNKDEDEELEYAFINKQPENSQEEALCLEMMDSCPSNAIGDDG